ncbi:thrombospondin type-1 domain-containing 4-like [Micractinium conductrix]|uniref:Thrombospondin type-1 domain-containing 4-like n=1 Tax=Micractinium conductrix TaxID=554055 RepID=A0A2P6VQU3_9CHLO|nr:thrombospondin type-1 domain-containing 4-like [Micractinium conductrix]|eukprot:PSC76440.1 thrombospondin type-1 domain-containing 4-like [Micractinium conductrix]
MGTLAMALCRALPQGPAGLRPSQAGGDALALALHCLMVRDGYTALDRNGRRLRGYALPSDWDAVDFLWAWEYTRPGAARHFRLQCGLQPATRRMFIHASEVAPGGDPVQDNIQVMGVQLDNYVKLPRGDGAAAQPPSSWEGVLVGEQALRDMWAEFVSAPLWRLAGKAPAHGGAVGGWAAAAQQRCGALGEALGERRRALLLAAGVVVVAAGVLAYRRASASSAP